MRKLVVILLMLAYSTSYAMSELDCLAENIYREARGEPLVGKLAVGSVTLNRVNSPNFPKTICKVVFQPNQFSWTRNFSKPKANADAKKVAYMLLHGHYSPSSILYFHSIHSNPAWARRFRKVTRIANHIFYTDK